MPTASAAAAGTSSTPSASSIASTSGTSASTTRVAVAIAAVAVCAFAGTCRAMERHRGRNQFGRNTGVSCARKQIQSVESETEGDQQIGDDRRPVEQREAHSPLRAIGERRHGRYRICGALVCSAGLPTLSTHWTPRVPEMCRNRHETFALDRAV